MPKGNWGHGHIPVHPESERLFPQLEATPDLSRGEQRLAAEVMIEMFEGRNVPIPIIGRAISIANVMANG